MMGVGRGREAAKALLKSITIRPYIAYSGHFETFKQYSVSTLGMKCSTIPIQQGKNDIYGLAGTLPQKCEHRQTELNAGLEFAHNPHGGTCPIQARITRQTQAVMTE